MRRKHAKEIVKILPNPWEMRAVMLLGALEQIRREAKGMSGGWRARVLEIADLHLGPDLEKQELTPCP